MFQLKNVTALWPKIDRTYRFDKKEQRSVPCEPTADGAEYTLSVEMTPEQGNELHAYHEAKWKEFLKEPGNEKATKSNCPYEKNEQGLVVAKTKLKGAYNGEPTRKPPVFDAKNQQIADPNFQLTTGSTINIAITGVPYSGMGGGVQLRIKAIQVIELADKGGAVSPFGEAEGFSQPASPFTEATAAPVAATLEEDIPF
jgi:hypothetical protein